MRSGSLAMACPKDLKSEPRNTRKCRNWGCHFSRISCLALSLVTAYLSAPLGFSWTSALEITPHPCPSFAPVKSVSVCVHPWFSPGL